MTFTKAVLAGVLATGLTLPYAGIGLAQEAESGDTEAQAPAGEPGIIDEEASDTVGNASAEDNWLKVCSDLDEGGQACIMRQVVTNTGVFVGSFLLRDDPSQESRLLAVASVPLGVLLPFGLSWQIDGGKPVRVPYMICDPQACTAQLVVNEAYIQSLKRGATLTLTAKNRQNQDIEVDITLAGFTAVYDDPDALSIEELNQANSTENVLENVLQDRANQLREQIQTDGAGAEAPAAEGEAGAEAAPEEAPAQ